ncbi:uncharacterized protein TM35_000671240 [Trypanosoma theileri]|uniref:Mucin-associated surface protein (MASP) n=1 Tax=Trypanosoma theileri TaxID=67003 RepID=A0A1X0NG74_9TRYP|nr:uncharacterized protein TM35_000671240 [Trypanosoma theileri]ORC83518.1 hypothetical protein TM35_000671240 [Trypanosoma theileri]
MTKAVFVRCYLLCLLTLALCCACGLVWADSRKASAALIKPSTIGVSSLVSHAIPADGGWIVDEDEELQVEGEKDREKDGDRETKRIHEINEVEKTTISKPSTVSGSMGSEGSLGPQEIPVNPTVQQQRPPPPLASSHGKASAEGTPGAIGVDGLPGSPGVERSDMSESGRLGKSDPSIKVPDSGPTLMDQGRKSTDKEQVEESTRGDDQVTSGTTEHQAEASQISGKQPEETTPKTDGHQSPNSVSQQNTGGSGSSDNQNTAVQAPVSDTPQSSHAENNEHGKAENNVGQLQNGTDAESSSPLKDVTPSGSGSTNKPDDMGNTNTDTTTTTATTTLPPELTNNKKGDADSSSSSISSSVWVRVPLLIVVTLACILVC